MINFSKSTCLNFSIVSCVLIPRTSYTALDRSFPELHCVFFWGFLQIHPCADGAGEDLLEPRELQHGGEDLPQVGGVLQRARHVEAERRARALHAGEQIQRSDRILRAHRKETLR